MMKIDTTDKKKKKVKKLKKRLKRCKARLKAIEYVNALRMQQIIDLEDRLFRSMLSDVDPD